MISEAMRCTTAPPFPDLAMSPFPRLSLYALLSIPFHSCTPSALEDLIHVLPAILERRLEILEALA